MRLKNLILGEFRFLLKYGIIALYGIVTAIYLCLLATIPQSAREITTVILVFTDPAAMGLFFMGAVVLFEKSQRVESSLGVSPIRISEYIIAKTVPFLIVGTAVSLVLSIFAERENLVLILIGVALSSALFSLCGLCVGSNTRSLNSFMIATVPFEIFLCVPPILLVFGVIKSKLWLIHPGVAAIKLIKADQSLWYVAVLSLVLWIVPVYFLCKKAVMKSFRVMGGAKL